MPPVRRSLVSLLWVLVLIAPVLPKASVEILSQLNWEAEMKLAAAEWGILPDGHTVGKPTPLFPRIETAER